MSERGVIGRTMWGMWAMLTVWASMGCLVMESGGEEVPVDERPVDEFEGFEDLSSGEGTGQVSDMGEMTPPDMGDEPAPDMAPVDDRVILSGQVASGALPGAGQLMVLWYVSGGSPAYFYKQGGGMLDASGAWQIELADAPSSAPPEAAFEPDGFAVGLVVAVPEGAQVPQDGQLTRSQLREIEQSVIAASPRHGVMYVRSGMGSGEGREWVEKLARETYLCGEGRADGALGFDEVPCEAFAVEKTSQLSWVKW